MRYVSLFSGIGGFEVGVHAAFPNAECVGCSELDEHAARVYRTHFPGHLELGDVTRVCWDEVGRVDLVVGGPPCQNLSVAMGAGRCAGDARGLDGAQSSLFVYFERAVRACARHFVMENVASMSRANRDEITRRLREAYGAPVFCTLLDAGHVSAQRRRRHFWTSFPVDPLTNTDAPTLADVLDPTEVVASPAFAVGPTTLRRMGQVVPQWGKTRWQQGHYSDSANDKSITVTKSWRASTMGNMLIDRRFDEDLTHLGNTGCGRVRRFTPEETERLQTFPVGWTAALAKNRRYMVLGNAVACEVAAHVMRCLARHLEEDKELI